MHKRFSAVAIFAVFTFASCAADTPIPSPKWQPVQVVSFQLEAMRNNNPQNNKGFTAAYRFASPRNKAAIGGIKDFGRMLNSAFSDMLTHTAATLKIVKMLGDQAVIGATLTLPDKEKHRYFFVLTRHLGAPCDGCWFTDGVIPLEQNAPPPLRSI